MYSLSGPKQSCEDAVCSHCTQLPDFTSYKECKKRCFADRPDDIFNCCVKSCDILSIGAVKGKSVLNECIDACSTTSSF
jgi:hypothetical protein